MHNSKFFTLLVTLIVNKCLVIANYPIEICYKWSTVNFTFDSSHPYEEYLNQRKYIPENNVIAGIKIYKNQFYFALPRYREGTPVTLATIAQDAPVENPILTPFPNWQANVGEDCSTLQNVRNMEIDNNGIMWILDGVRISGISNSCPQKLVLLDLNQNGRIVHTYTFPEEISSKQNGYLNYIGLDNGYAFITETSNVSPGLVIYSRDEDKAWKLFDAASMLAEEGVANFQMNGDPITRKVAKNIFGLTVSPVSENERYVYYAPASGYQIYSIPLNVLKDKSLYENSDSWKRQIKKVTERESGQGAGLAMDNQNTLWYTNTETHSIGAFKNGGNEIVYSNEETLDFPETFAFDNIGSMFITSNKYIYKIVDLFREVPKPSSEFIYFVTKISTGAKSYLYA